MGDDTQAGDTPVGGRVAVVFRTHFWDDFTRRQFRRLASCTGSDVFVLVDETRGRVEGIEHDRVVRVTESQVLAQGFAPGGEGNLFWFNGDYPMYHFRRLHPGYDHYLQLEYDVVFNLDIDALMRKVAADRADFVGLTKGEPAPEWQWVHTMGAYAPADIRHQLICVSVFSGRALDFLAGRRLAMAAQDRSPKNWPMCEGFIATELALGGFRVHELSEYGDTFAYDHWPPFVEGDLGLLGGYPFVHPVLDEPRYVASLLKYHVGLRGFLDPGSVLHRKLRRLPWPSYLRTLARAFGAKVVRNLGRRVPHQRAPRPA